ncbi:MAG: hypothetical protein BWX64_02193 [Acidobacteria bacterium ADurb.Bin051]|nr:MAG: hypothetical protein BWX64_02193 [Acidobacteria bacterium ADurb.Bin051]
MLDLPGTDRRPEEDEELVAAHARDADQILLLEHLGRRPHEGRGQLPQQPVVSLPPEDLLDPFLAAQIEEDETDRLSGLQPAADRLEDRRQGGQAGGGIVEAGPELEELRAGFEQAGIVAHGFSALPSPRIDSMRATTSSIATGLAR